MEIVAVGGGVCNKLAIVERCNFCALISVNELKIVHFSPFSGITNIVTNFFVLQAFINSQEIKVQNNLNLKRSFIHCNR